MENANYIEAGQKILSISDGHEAPHTNFVQEAEHETMGLKLRYYMWLSRLFIFFSSLSLLFFLSCSLALFHLAPMVEVEPFLIIQQDSSENLVRSEPIGENMSSQDLLLETFIKQYVILRNTVINDTREMYSRWLPGGMVHFLSSWPVFSEFSNKIEQKIMQLASQGMVKEVEIISIGRQGGRKSEIWKVDFKTYEVTSGNSRSSGALLMKERYWTASVTARFYPERIFVGRRLINPTGFTVIRYSQSEVDIF